MKTQAGVGVIIAGSRTITDYFAMTHAIELSGMKIQQLASGGTRGVDSLGERYAREHGIPIRLFPAGSERFGKSAGYRHHERVAKYVDALIGVWAGSKETVHMVQIAKRHCPAVYVDSRNAA